MILRIKEAPGMKEISKLLAERDEAGKWKGRRVMSYVSQSGVLYREVITVGNALDLLLQGRLPECGDLLIQRLKAL